MPMKIHPKKIKLTREEKEIERAIGRGEYVPAPPEHFRMVAQSIAHFKKNAVISLRLNQGMLDRIKRNAAQHGVPYQRFITEILYRYAA